MIDDSTIPDIRAELERLRECNQDAQREIELIWGDLRAVERRALLHVCDPHPSQSEVAALRIILRAVSSRLAVIEDQLHKAGKGADHASH